MANQNEYEDKLNRVTLDVQDLISIASRTKGSPISNSTGITESEELKKAWFNHVLISIEKLNDLVEKMRREDIVNIKKEFSEELKVIEKEYKDEIRRLENKITKSNSDFLTYKEKIIIPMSNRLLILSTRISVWSVLAGIIGSGIITTIFWLLRDFLGKS